MCPISCDIMKDPVMCADGKTYERAQIEQHFAREPPDIKQFVVQWVKVKGHSDHEGNDAADTRANWAQNGGAKNETDINNLMAYIRQHG